MLFRKPHWRIRLGALGRGGYAGCLRVLALRLALGLTLVLLGPVGCAHAPKGERVHVVHKGENLYRISKHYGVSVESIKRANGIRDVTSIPVGTRLLIPSSNRSVRRSAPVPRVPSSVSAKGFSWPVKGVVTSGFGRRHGRPHEGIDISVGFGTMVGASAPGRVIFSGSERGYGKMVVIKHQGVFTTVYAHNKRNLVKAGTFVERGQRIAEAGKTGNVRAKGPVVHFEIRSRNKPVNPLPYLGKR